MNPEKLGEILQCHARWVRGHSNGARANLTGADLTHADLTGANLISADLTRADLTDANLTGANLTDAILTAGTFYGAVLDDVWIGPNATRGPGVRLWVLTEDESEIIRQWRAK